MPTPAKELERDLIDHPEKIIIVVGTGVSLASCGKNPCASWKGFMEHGLQLCEDVCGTDTGLIKNNRENLENSNASLHVWISVAQFITDELKNHREGIFRKWLNDSIGSIKLYDKSLVESISSLGTKIATTNYDDILTIGTGRHPVTWDQPEIVSSFIEEQHSHRLILHLHGHYKSPDSIIFGINSYSSIVTNPLIREILRGFFIFNKLVFVGCGAGLEDPSFQDLLDWTRKNLQKFPMSHFILVKNDEVKEWRPRLQSTPIEPIPYGNDYSDLPSFLQNLADDVRKRKVTDPLLKLTPSQSNFDEKWEELELNKENYSPLEYFSKSKLLAEELFKQGGFSRAAQAFSNRLTFQGKNLLALEFVEFAIAAIEMLLKVDMTENAYYHLMHITRVLEKTEIPEKLHNKYILISVRCWDKLCAYSESLEAIKIAAAKSQKEEKERLLAEYCEINFLQGDFDKAISDI